MRLAVTNYVYLRYPFEEAVKRIAEAGYDGIEIWGGRPHVYPPDVNEEKAKEIKKLVDDHGLEIVCFTPEQCFYPVNISSPYEKEREESIEYMKKSIDVAAMLETKMMVITPGYAVKDGTNKKKAWDRLVETLRELAMYAEGKGVILAMEPLTLYETNLVSTLYDLEALLEDVGSEHLKGMVDTGHANVTKESAIEYVRRLGKNLVHVHVDDNDGSADSHLIPGRGTFDFKSFISVLKASGYKGYLSVELGFMYTVDPDSAIIESKRYLDSILREV